jgi:hypothetical protein
MISLINILKIKLMIKNTIVNKMTKMVNIKFLILTIIIKKIIY